MPNIKSSKKAVKVIAKKTDNNHELKARVKNSIKNTDKELATTLFKDTQKSIDKAVSKGFMKKNTASRQKSRLAQKVKNMK